VISLLQIQIIYCHLLIRCQVKKPFIYLMTIDDWVADQRNSK